MKNRAEHKNEYKAKMHFVAQLVMFLLILSLMLWFLFSLYNKNIKDIIGGTYVYDRFETPLMLSPFLLLFMFFLYILVRFISRRKKTKKKIKNKVKDRDQA